MESEFRVTSVSDRIWRAILLAMVLASSVAAADDAPIAAAITRDFDHTHAAWSSLLAAYVYEGRVDYARWKSEGRAALEAYLATLEAVDPSTYATWTREQRLAFWIDGYNAAMVKMILDHHPLESVREIGVLPFAAFKDDFIPMQRLRGKKLSLDEIEHTILRKELQEPLIHFGIVCASKSCPVLQAEAYRGADLRGQLEAAARRFLADSFRNRVAADGRTVSLSSIFKWFREDFERNETLAAFVSRYAPADMAAALARPGGQIEFLDYDWSLNGL